MDIDKALKTGNKKEFSSNNELFSEQSKLEFMNTPKENLALYHFSLGTWIRNFVLSNDRVVYKLFIKTGIRQKDDMSMIITGNFINICQNSYNENNH